MTGGPVPRDVRSQVVAAYDAMLAEYDQLEEQFYFAQCYQAYRECAWRIASERPDGLALDLGCGTGKQTILLARREGRVIGVDFSERMIEVARKRCEGQPNVGFVAADITRLPLADGCAEVVVAYGDVVGHNFAAVDTVLKEMVRVCAPRGLISFEVDSKWCPDLLYLPREAWRAITTRGGHLREWKGMQFKTFTWRELRRLLRAHGLRLVEARGINIVSMLFPPALLFRRQADAPRFGLVFRYVMKLDLVLGRFLRCGSTRIVIVEKP
jgi:ubiquinone/menaquinone biosynthesis C-methylase UbiE